jgi:fumarylacetoacetase
MRNATHDPARRSWLASANLEGCDFPIQNLPFGCFQSGGGAPRCGVAIGDYIFDLRAGLSAGLFDGDAQTAAEAASGTDLAALLALGNGPASVLRRRLSDLLLDGGEWQSRAEPLAADLLVPQSAATMLLPMPVRQFSDMCASTFHIGRHRGVDSNGEPACPPVFRTLPVGYDGRASSVVVSGSPVRRPNGSWEPRPGSGELRFGPEPRQDYELELGMWYGGPPTRLGNPIPVKSADAAIFGFTLLNDWSARGIQFWETMLGPFLGKSIATTVSPWIVTSEALAPFRAAAFARPACDPSAPTHLFCARDQAEGGLDIRLDAYLTSSEMRRNGTPPLPICSTNARYLYWTPAQMFAHHMSNGCAMAAGDLVGTGTVSGPSLEEAACLRERNIQGDLDLPGGERRAWLEDGDELLIRGRAERPGFVTIGFGEARGVIEPALDWDKEVEGAVS